MYCEFCLTQHTGPHIHAPEQSNRSFMRELIEQSLVEGIVIAGLVVMGAMALFSLRSWI